MEEITILHEFPIIFTKDAQWVDQRKIFAQLRNGDVILLPCQWLSSRFVTHSYFHYMTALPTSIPEIEIIHDTSTFRTCRVPIIRIIHINLFLFRWFFQGNSFLSREHFIGIFWDHFSRRSSPVSSIISHISTMRDTVLSPILSASSSSDRFEVNIMGTIRSYFRLIMT